MNTLATKDNADSDLTHDDPFLSLKEESITIHSQHKVTDSDYVVKGKGQNIWLKVTCFMF